MKEASALIDKTIAYSLTDAAGLMKVNFKNQV